MKDCPRCGSRVAAETECPICGETLTYLPTVEGERERIPWSQYSLVYYARRSRLAAVALAVLTGFMFCFGASPWFLGGLGVCVLIWVYAFFGRAIDRLEMRLDEYLHGSNFRGEEYWAHRRVMTFVGLFVLLGACILAGVVAKVWGM